MRLYDDNGNRTSQSGTIRLFSDAQRTAWQTQEEEKKKKREADQQAQLKASQEAQQRLNEQNKPFTEKVADFGKKVGSFFTNLNKLSTSNNQQTSQDMNAPQIISPKQPTTITEAMVYNKKVGEGTAPKLPTTYKEVLEQSTIKLPENKEDKKPVPYALPTEERIADYKKKEQNIDDILSKFYAYQGGATNEDVAKRSEQINRMRELESAFTSKGIDFNKDMNSRMSAIVQKYKQGQQLTEDDQQILEYNNVKIAVEKKSFLYLAGTILEFSGGLNGKGFVFNNPNAQRTCGCGESFSL